MRQQLMGAIAIAEREQIARHYAESRDRERDHDHSHAPIQSLGRERTSEVELER